MTDPGDDGTGDCAVALRRLEWTDGSGHWSEDHVAAEAPLEIRIAGIPVAVVMRTPGCDEDLVHGFLLSERIAQRPESITSVRHCSDVDVPEAEDNIVQVVLDHGVDLAGLRRNLFASSSCGVCGKASIEKAMAHAGPLEHHVTMRAEDLLTLPQRLARGQVGFDVTGGVHAAALFDADLGTIAIREDVGRHNAVDKVIGAAARQGRRGSVLMVSGRVSFEIVQKALAVGVEIVAAVSAPSSLAVDLARSSAMTLVAFVRAPRMCIYTGEDRITG